MKVTAGAPGKVVILGEYAVLEGAPALVMAVDRRVGVRLETHDGPECSAAAPGWSRQARFRLGPAGPVWRDGAGRFALAEHVMRAFFEWRGEAGCPPFDLVLDSRPLAIEGAGKLGLGSSAALTVALCSALGYYVATQQETPRTPDLSTLIDIHSGLQGRRGSGLDVAASLWGGLIEYRRLPAPGARAAVLPSDLAYCFVWSGRQAATGRFLAGLDRWRRDNETRYRRLIGPLAEMAAAGVQAARANKSGEFLRMLDDYAAALQELGSASDTDILSEPHRRLRDMGKRYGIVYKPCGAGGGDIGVGMSRDPEALAAFQAGLAAERFQSLSLNIDRDGVQARSEN